MAIKETWVFPHNGGEPYRKGERMPYEAPRGVTIMGDLPDFVSPVDGRAYSGRAGLREHNLRNNVVPVADLAGLPYLQTNSDTRSERERKQDAQMRKSIIINQVNQHVR
jgi:hypothetical protein